MKRRTLLALSVALLAHGCASLGTAAAQGYFERDRNPNKITILIPSFTGDPPPLGESVGTILMLQVWKQLRGAAACAPPAGAQAKSPCLRFFEAGHFRWQKQPLASATHEGARTTGMLPTYRAQLVLWGKTYKYGHDVVVLAFLTLPEGGDRRTRRSERWSLTISAPKKTYTIDTDIPTRNFAFEPMVLTSEFVSEFSLPTKLKVYRTPMGQGFVGYAKPPILEKRGETSNALQTEQGWILIPELSAVPSEIVGFVGGVMRVFRSDWDGARELLEPVAKNPRTPTELRIDSMLLMGLASYHLGGDFQSHLRAAESLNPLASRVVRYRVMGMLTELRNSDPRARTELGIETKKYLDARRHLFAADDRWVLAVDELLIAVAGQ